MINSFIKTIQELIKYGEETPSSRKLKKIYKKIPYIVNWKFGNYSIIRNGEHSEFLRDSYRIWHIHTHLYYNKYHDELIWGKTSYTDWTFIEALNLIHKEKETFII